MNESMEILKIILRKVELLQIDIRFLKENRLSGKEDTIVDVDEVCRMLRLSERQVRRLITKQELKGFMIGHRRVFNKSEITDFIIKRNNQNL